MALDWRYCWLTGRVAVPCPLVCQFEIYTTYISGDNRGYSGTIPTELGDLTGITGLNLYFNKVSTATDRPRPHLHV